MNGFRMSTVGLWIFASVAANRKRAPARVPGQSATDAALPANSESERKIFLRR